MLLLAQYAVFNENELMSKLKGFFKKLGKKSKSSEDVEDIVEDEIEDDDSEHEEEDQDEIEYIDEDEVEYIDEDVSESTEEEVSEEIEPVYASEVQTSGEATQVVDLNDLDGELDGFELGEETVILDGIELSEELIPHESQQEAQLPADDDLKFPSIPEQQDDSTTIMSHDDSVEEPIAQESHIEPEMPSEDDLDYPEITEATEEHQIDEIMVKEDETQSEISIDDELSESEEETSPFEDEQNYEAQAPEVEENYALNIEDDENYQVTTETDSETLDLTKTGFSIRDKVEQLKVRVVDQFRNFNKKDLNQAFGASHDGKPKIDFEGLKNSASKINWANIPTQFFSKGFRSEVHNIFQKAFVLILFFAFAKVVGMLIEGSPDYNNLTKKNYLTFDDSKKLSRNDVKRIQNANIFKTNQVVVVKQDNKPKVNVNKICTKASKKSRSTAKLLSSIVLQDSVKSVASVQVKSGKKGLKYLREGDSIDSTYKVDKIEGLKLIVKNLTTGDCEYIENKINKKKLARVKKPKVLSPKKSAEFKKKNKKISGIDTDGNNFNIKKSFLQSKLKDINSLLTQARGIPIRNPDGTLSFKIVEIEPGGIFDYLGITDGDVINQINGNPINEMNDVMNLFGKISKLSNLSLTINRGGEDVTQSYNIK